MNPKPGAGWAPYAELGSNPLLWLVLVLTGCLIYTLAGRSAPAPGTLFTVAAAGAAVPQPGAAPQNPVQVQEPPAPLSPAQTLQTPQTPALQNPVIAPPQTPLPPVPGVLPPGNTPAPLPSVPAAGPPATPPAETTPGYSIVSKVIVLLLLAVIYVLAYQPWANYTLVFVLGALVAAYIGSLMRFYGLSLAWKALAGNLDVICFLAGMNLLTAALALGGLFDYLGRKIAKVSGGDPWRIMAGFCLLTYALSLLVNNLTTMLVLIPIILSLCRSLDLDPQPYLVGMIVASNLGGASTMIGDFPNILIGTRAGVGFNQFLTHMMPICLVLLFVLLAYMRLTQVSLWAALPRKQRGASLPGYGSLFVSASRPAAAASYSSPFSDRREARPETFKDPRAVHRGLLILAAALTAFIFCGRLGLPPALIAAAAGLAALFLSGLDKGRILAELDYRDIFFFAGLFVLVGAARASGLLDWFGEIIVHLSFGSVLARCLLLMWVAAAATAFLNAGPCTALFLPLVLGFKTAAPQNLYWWALSLGVLAGSSATLTGATAGSVTATMLASYRASLDRPGPRMTFLSYAREAAPLALIFLAVSSVYITWLYKAG